MRAARVLFPGLLLVAVAVQPGLAGRTLTQSSGSADKVELGTSRSSASPTALTTETGAGSFLEPQQGHERSLQAMVGGRPRCGTTAGRTRCATGMCCSAAGFCGTGFAFCNAGCQARFGLCNSKFRSPKPSPSPSPKTAEAAKPVASPSPRPSSSPNVTASTVLPNSPQVQGPATLLGTTRATYHYYGDAGYVVSTLYCADAFQGKSPEWLKQYPWTAYCLPFMGGMQQALCGKCLRLTNQRTKAQLTARIVDMCGHGALDLDWTATFQPLDTDRQGYLDGRLSLTVESVPC